MIQSILRKLKPSHHSLGIEITDNLVKICEIQENDKQGPKVLNGLAGPLPTGIMDDGRMTNKTELLHTLKTMLAAAKFGTRDVHFALPSQLVMVRNLKLPDLSVHELKKLVAFEMDNNMSVAFDEPYYDFIKLPAASFVQADEAPEAAPNLCNVLVVAAPMDLLKEFCQIFEEVDLVVRSIEIKAFSLLRLLEKIAMPLNGVNMIVDVNESNTELIIVEEGNFKITRNIEISFKAHNQREEEGEGNALLESFASPELAFQNSAQDLISEMERLMNFYYYTLKNGDQRFSSVFLTGDIRSMDKLSAIMQAGLPQKVIPIEWGALSVAADLHNWDVQANAVPLGLALRGKE